MSGTTVLSFFQDFKEWLSFIDSAFGVAGVIIIIMLFIMNHMRKKTSVSSAKIKLVSGQLKIIGEAVEELEVDNKRLKNELMQMSSRNLECVMTVSKKYKLFSNKNIVVKELSDCYRYNSPYLAEITAVLARVHLDAFYSNDDFDQLKESERFATIANLVTPAAVETRTLRAEIAIVIATHAATMKPTKPVDDTWDEALELLRSSEESVGDEQRFITLERLGTQLRGEGQFELAGAAIRAAYRASERAFGALSIQTITALGNVATNYDDRGFSELAKPIYEELIEKKQNSIGYFDEQVYSFKLAYAGCSLKLCGGEDSLMVIEGLVKDGLDRFGPDNRWVLKAQNYLAVCLVAVGREIEAEQLYRETIVRETRVFGNDHINPLSTRTNLANRLMKTGRKDEAIEEFTDIVQRRLRLHGADHPHAQDVKRQLELMQAANT